MCFIILYNLITGGDIDYIEHALQKTCRFPHVFFNIGTLQWETPHIQTPVENQYAGELENSFDLKSQQSEVLISNLYLYSVEWNR